ncbi:hypothetical protein [Hymenobacter sp. AT01-02]|uniref:hypothetical protein n=1 Tax=Hymenobacter sp. AT01-02 TaxID=1571877 RepID=UPI0006E28628|nr:hypothetical protein [Hymenobacter sp. AT01-02]
MFLTKKSLKKAFLDIKNIFIQLGKIPLIHIEAHGAHDFLKLESGEEVSWVVVAHLLGEVNRLLKNKLIVVLASCHGIQLHKTINVLTPVPFYLLVAPLATAYEQDIKSGFVEFYENWIDHTSDNEIGKNFNRAIRLLNEDRDTEFKYVLSELAFDNRWNQFLKEYPTKERLNSLVDKMLSTMVIRGANPDQLRLLFTSIPEFPDQSKEYFRKKFLMLD